MISQTRRSDPTPVSNDNGRFADLRRTGPSGGAGVIALAAGRGPVSLSYVADGVMIISRDAAARDGAGPRRLSA
jgi:hypothetical protein